MEKTQDRPSKLLWLDLETGGLDEEKQPIIEVAARATDGLFQTLSEFHRIVFTSEDQQKKFEPEAYQMHKDNGLLDKLADGASVVIVEQAFCVWVEKFWGHEKAILAGNSVHRDLAFIKRWMPNAWKRLHYRVLDVSSFKCLFQLKYGMEYQKNSHHRALEDIDLSMDELKTYIKFLSDPLEKDEKA